MKSCGRVNCKSVKEFPRDKRVGDVGDGCRRGVRRIDAGEDFRFEREAVLLDLGRIVNHARVAEVASLKVVVDPVLVATSGARLVPDAALRAVCTRLLPLATLITPNLPEAETLCGRAVGDPNAARAGDAAHAEALARQIHETYGCAVLVKGGHGASAAAVDVLYDGHAVRTFALPWVGDPVSTHGTGCSLAAALAAELARGRPLAEAVAGAKGYVHAAIAGSYWVGPDCGVLGFVRQGGDHE